MKNRILASIAVWIGAVLPLLAAPTVYEGWNYTLTTVYTGGVNGVLNTGTGWSGKWTGDSTDNPRVFSNSLAYTGLTTNGHHGEVGWNGSAAFPTRNMSTTFSADGATAWFAWLQTKAATSVESYVKLRNNSPVTTMISCGETHDWGSPVGYTGRWRLKVGPTEKDSGVTANTTPAFVVWKVVFKSGNDDVWVWVNPDTGREPRTINATASWSGSEGTNVVVNQLMLQGGYNAGGTAMTMDEFRAGSTYWDVVDRPPPPTGTMVMVR